ncbi:hypothetical protein Ciccas_004506 [Cichlidogyrus casuarinus]|uniref:Uncharacterized protein n=1 Tax=Cichlidogyrus casuarinus TaxID=1844966 RepID=A0ABD2QDM7_9PLAT
MGQMPSLRELHLNANPSLGNLPAELSQCPRLTILNLEGCSLSELPRLIVDGGSAMIIYVSFYCFQFTCM